MTDLRRAAVVAIVAGAVASAATACGSFGAGEPTPGSSDASPDASRDVVVTLLDGAAPPPTDAGCGHFACDGFDDVTFPHAQWTPVVTAPARIERSTAQAASPPASLRVVVPPDAGLVNAVLLRTTPPSVPRVSCSLSVRLDAVAALGSGERSLVRFDIRPGAVPAVDQMDVRLDVGSDAIAVAYRQRPAGQGQVADVKKAPALPFGKWSRVGLTMRLDTQAVELKVDDVVVAATTFPSAVTTHDGVTVAIGVGYTRDPSEWSIDDVVCDAQ